MKRLFTRICALLAPLAIGVACAGADTDENTGTQQLAEVNAPTKAVCSILVTGTGNLDIESEYLPNVIACEASGSAGLETLKAQAIAARSVTYYEALGDGSICDSQGCQVMSCGRKPSALHYQAVQETAYQYLTHSGLVTYGFYVSGDASPDSTSCVGKSSVNIEKYITYNDGLSGASVKMSKLGYIPKGGGVFGQNRGCMSQNGSVCLEKQGKSHLDILRFYYGADIEVRTGVACSGAPPPPAPTPEPPTTEPPPASGALAPMTREEIISIAKSGMGYSYRWGGATWDPSGPNFPGVCHKACLEPSCHSASKGGPEWGMDCSGFVQQVWQAPRPNPVNRELGNERYSTHNFRNEEKDWFRLGSRDEMERGDALVYRGKSGGHIVLFEKWLNNGQALVYECASCNTGCVHRARSIGAAYIPIRRKLVNDVEEKELEGELETASCEEISGFARDPANPETSLEVAITTDRPLPENAQTQSQEAPPQVLLTLKANHKRPDLCPKGGSCFHGFIAAPPEELLDGLSHRVYVYALGAGLEKPRLLGGSPRSLKCDPPTVGTCEHSPCTEGAALDPTCDNCVNWICLEIPECCTSNWDAACVERVATLPGSACTGLCAGGANSCGHSECAEGGALPTTCSSCADAVCKRDPFCCNHSWDLICAGEAKENAFCSCQ